MKVSVKWNSPQIKKNETMSKALHGNYSDVIYSWTSDSFVMFSNLIYDFMEKHSIVNFEFISKTKKTAGSLEYSYGLMFTVKTSSFGANTFDQLFLKFKERIDRSVLNCTTAIGTHASGTASKSQQLEQNNIIALD